MSMAGARFVGGTSAPWRARLISTQSQTKIGRHSVRAATEADRRQTPVCPIPPSSKSPSEPTPGPALQLAYSTSGVGVKAERDALQHPVRRVLSGREVGLEDHPDAHRVPTRLGDVYGCAEGTLQLELGRLDRDDLKQRQLDHEHLRLLDTGAVVLYVPV